MNDSVDEVISTAVYALSSLFANERIGEKNQMVKTVMKNVWQLLDGDLVDGVSSLLNDLLCITQTWLCVEVESALSLQQFRHIVNLFDPAQISSTVRAMECIYLTLSKDTRLGDEVQFLKFTCN
jgi:hypothetical protein